jgi:hypothetical protein
MLFSGLAEVLLKEIRDTCGTAGPEIAEFIGLGFEERFDESLFKTFVVCG